MSIATVIALAIEAGFAVTAIVCVLLWSRERLATAAAIAERDGALDKADEWERRALAISGQLKERNAEIRSCEQDLILDLAGGRVGNTDRIRSRFDRLFGTTARSGSDAITGLSDGSGAVAAEDRSRG